MTRERLEEIKEHLRRQFADEPIILKTPSMAMELADAMEAVSEENDALKAWKAEQLAVEATWDDQAVAELIGVPLGHKIRPAIQPAIEALISENVSLKQRVQELEAMLEARRDVLKSVSVNETLGGKP